MQKLNVAPDLDLGHYTHEKNPLTTRAALTTIEIIESEGLVERAAQLGTLIVAKIAEMASRQSVIAGVRGKGLLLAVEFAPHHCGMEPGEKFTDTLIEAFWREGLSTTSKGPVSVGFSPPLTIADDEIAEALTRVERVANTLMDKSVSGAQRAKLDDHAV